MSAADFDPIGFLERAVRTPSHEDVTEMRALLVDALEEGGTEPRVDGAGNVIATRGTGDPHVVLNTHVDTVAPHVPYEREEGVIRGRGACDAKGPLAAFLTAFLAVEPAGGRVTLAITPDEETRSTGAAALDLDADAFVVGEPTGLDVCNAAKGRFEGTITVRGENAHAAEPGTGTNAIGAAGRVIGSLDRFDARPDSPAAHPDLGAPTLTPTTIEGGTSTNQVPAECRITVDRRSVPPETSEGFAAALNDHLREVRADASFALTDRETPFLEAFETDPESRLVRAIRSAGAGEIRPFAAATEASYFARAAPTVVFGPGVLADGGGAVAHAPREYVRVEDVERAAAIVERTLDGYVG